MLCCWATSGWRDFRGLVKYLIASDEMKKSLHWRWHFANELRFAGAGAVELPQQKEKKKQEKVVAKEQEKIAQRANLEIRGNKAFDEKTLRSQLKEQIATIEQFGLTTARATTRPFFSSSITRSTATPGEGELCPRRWKPTPPRYRGSRSCTWAGLFLSAPASCQSASFLNTRRPDSGAFFQGAVAAAFRQHRHRRSADLVRRFTIRKVSSIARSRSQPTITSSPIWSTSARPARGQQYFSATSICWSDDLRCEALRARCSTCSPSLHRGTTGRYSAALQSYYKTRGYFAVKVDVIGEPTLAIHGKCRCG